MGVFISIFRSVTLAQGKIENDFINLDDETSFNFFGY